MKALILAAGRGTRVRRLRFSTVTGAVILLALVACGGGSGGDPKVAPQATKLDKIVPQENFNFASFRAPIGLLSTRLIANPTTSGFTDAARTYVSIWYIDNDANRQQLAFMTMKAFQTLDASGGIRLRVPGNVSALAYEIYDHDSAVSGGVPL